MSRTKLVRDKIIDIMKEKGKIPEYHVADDNEYRNFLIEKLKEEAEELRPGPSNEELADLLEAVHSLVELDGSKMDEVEKIRKEKNEKRGSFKKKLILHKIDM